MKKFLATFFIFIIGFTAVSRAEASSVIFKPNVVSVQVGKTFTLPVVIDAEGTQQYTVRLFLTFSPDLLEVTSFSFAPNWIVLSQPGYDSIDNKQGELIKTAGFPKGFSTPASFGTITFRAKNSGESAIIVGPKSFILDARNNSTLSSRPQVRVIVTKGAVVPEVPSVQPLPNLPAPPQNIFDIISVPSPTGNRLSVVFLIILFIVAALLGIIGRIIFVKLGHWLIIRKTKHDKDI